MATTLSILNRPDELPKLFAHAIESGPDAKEARPSSDDELKIARRFREALIKAAAVGGLPKTINSLMALKTVTPEHLLDEPLESSATNRRADMYETSSSEVLSRGQGFFDAVYGRVSRKIMGLMDRSGTEDLGLTARLVYGYVLSNTNVLSQAETSFTIIAALIPQDVNPQLKGHLRGAVNGGATREEVTAVRGAVIKVCEAAGMKRVGNDNAAGWGWRSEVANL